MKISSITDPVTAEGLKLAGIKEVHETEDPQEAQGLLDELRDDEEMGVIILTEDLAQKMNKDVIESERGKEGITPIVIEIPSKEGPIPERREFIDQLVKRAVGIKVEE